MLSSHLLLLPLLAGLVLIKGAFARLKGEAVYLSKFDKPNCVGEVSGDRIYLEENQCMTFISKSFWLEPWQRRDHIVCQLSMFTEPDCWPQRDEAIRRIALPMEFDTCQHMTVDAGSIIMHCRYPFPMRTVNHTFFSSESEAEEVYLNQTASSEPKAEKVSLNHTVSSGSESGKLSPNATTSSVSKLAKRRAHPKYNVKFLWMQQVWLNKPVCYQCWTEKENNNFQHFKCLWSIAIWSDLCGPPPTVPAGSTSTSTATLAGNPSGITTKTEYAPLPIPTESYRPAKNDNHLEKRSGHHQVQDIVLQNPWFPANLACAKARWYYRGDSYSHIEISDTKVIDFCYPGVYVPAVNYPPAVLTTTTIRGPYATTITTTITVGGPRATSSASS